MQGDTMSNYKQVPQLLEKRSGTDALQTPRLSVPLFPPKPKLAFVQDDPRLIKEGLIPPNSSIPNSVVVPSLLRLPGAPSQPPPTARWLQQTSQYTSLIR